MASWVRIGTALYLALALPGLIFGFLLKVDELDRPCVRDEWLGLDTFRAPTSGVPCTSFDLTVMFVIVPAIALVVIGLGVARARTAS